MSLRVLVAGGTGFIGGRVVSVLAAAGHRVETLGRSARPLPPGVVARTADRNDPEAVARALTGQRFDATFDGAAWDRAHVEHLLASPGFDPGRYVFLSTGQVCLAGTAPAMPFREEDAAFPLKPEPAAGTKDHRQWSYGAGKRAAEAAVAEARISRGLDAVTLRLPVILGAGGDASLRTWAYLERMLDGGPLLVPAGGEQPVRFMWVDDVASAFLRILDRWPLPGDVYHLAQPDIVRLIDALGIMAEAAGRDPAFVPISYAALAESGLGPECSPYSGSWVSVLDPGRAERDWGFEAAPLERYLPGVVRGQLQHPPAVSHPGYALRERELAVARELGSRMA